MESPVLGRGWAAPVRAPPHGAFRAGSWERVGGSTGWLLFSFWKLARQLAGEGQAAGEPASSGGVLGGSAPASTG